MYRSQTVHLASCDIYLTITCKFEILICNYTTEYGIIDTDM